ncbi:MAG: PIN domain-containing protein [Opitutaceae bacterium]
MDSTDEDRLFLSAVTLAELHRGVQRLPDGGRRRRLHAWLSGDLTERLRGRILPVEERVAEAWGLIASEREATGRPISAIDVFLAATARVHHLTVATRNLADFPGTVPAVDPLS